MKIQTLTKRSFFPVILAAIGLFPTLVQSQVPIRPLEKDSSGPKGLPPIVSTLTETMSKSKESESSRESSSSRNSASSRNAATSLPPIFPKLDQAKTIKPIAPKVSSRKSESAVIVAKRKDVAVTKKQTEKPTVKALPVVKPWDGKSMVDLPASKIPVVQKPRVTLDKQKSVTVTPANFENPKKPLPIITRTDSQKEIDTSKQMFIKLPKSALKKTEPIMVTKNPAAFSENKSTRAVANRNVIPVKNWTPPTSVDLSSLPTTAPISKSLPRIPGTGTSKVGYEDGRNLTWNTNSVKPVSKSALPQSPALSQQELKSQIEALMPKAKKASQGEKIGRFVSNPYIQESHETNSFVDTEISKATIGKSRIKPVAQPKQIMPDVPMTGSDSEVYETVGGTIYPRSPVAVLRGEALFMTRERGGVSFSDQFAMDPFDYEMGFRLNAQRLFGVGGRSLTYTGIQDWNAVNRIGGGGLGIAPVAGVGLPAGVLDPFTGAIFQQQHHRANYHSLEWNTITWGWDVLNLFWGVRVTHYEEEFSFFSARADGQQGLLDMDVENFVIGPQVGGEVYYDIGRMFSTGVKVKLGAMATGVESETQLISNGLRRINNADSDVKFNFLAEVGVFGRMRLGPRAFLRGGYELWYNSSMFGVNDNIPGSITPAFGQTAFDDDILIHGATAGLEILW